MKKNIFSKDIELGKNVFIDNTAVIRGVNGDAEKIKIGDNAYIGANVQIICDNFSIGDYSKIHHHTNIHGYKPCDIGHNAWIGQYTIIDAIGGVKIGNNCGIGAQSQLWSHIKYGDTLEGCRFKSETPLDIGDDVWFVGHCIVSPITAHDKSMALAGSVITKDMLRNHIYAGTPAKSLSDKAGYQFNDVSIDQKYEEMIKILKSWNGRKDKIKIVKSEKEFVSNDQCTYFSVENRTYTKKGNEEEINFMKFLLPDKAKFIPYC